MAGAVLAAPAAFCTSCGGPLAAAAAAAAVLAATGEVTFSTGMPACEGIEETAATPPPYMLATGVCCAAA
jgi:hypothetical protein